MITVIGIFEDVSLADDACEYLLGNEFTAESLDRHTHGTAAATQPNHEAGAIDRIGTFFSHLFDDEGEAKAHATAGRSGTIVTIHAPSARLAQEAVDALNYYGAIDVNAFSEDTTGQRSRMVERVVDDSIRLRG
ncbi:hypothetical protein [Mucilaginibacter sp. FT3.2]|uniref:hypothetical protein n=1 Tax=Mucilaginibacter sp. FT3.2 TaxID=2723090 RepID=UPI001612FE04|nr:hypothetical protein [Mucilaginibacter sp. FT3.2]MBB6231158.1 hypothetical protein [Mucilaginibacter sp. FT3.2]